ncbi:hypothetical protein, partial [Runella sp.]|uniref:hypothetical protein n=1 Tax=Runella sp. TaxID=1960881 RepID=UPI0030197D70
LIWDYRFDSPTQNNYDLPVKMLMDEFGNAIVLTVSRGINTYFLASPSIGHLLKVGANGQLQWQIDFDTLVNTHQSNSFFDAFIDANGNYTVTYSAYANFGERPTYFMKFNPEGHLIKSFQNYNILQSETGGPFASAETIDNEHNFVFLHRTIDAPVQFSSLKINPETQAEKFQDFSLAGLNSADSLNWGYLTWDDIYMDENDNIYSFNNVDFPISSAFFLVKVDTAGIVNYILRPDSFQIHLAGIAFRQGSVYITGSYIPKGEDNTVAFVWKLNKQGQREYERIEHLPHDCVPRYLTIIQEKIYWATEDLYTGTVLLKQLNKENLAVDWVYALNHDQSYYFTGSNMAKLPNGLLAIGGTMRKVKHSGSIYLSEEDYYVELFSPTQQELYAQYRMTEKGTTNTESIEFSIDPQGNIIQKTVEVDGPEYYLNLYVPRKYYYRKFSADLTLQWEIESQYDAYLNWGISAFYFDHSGNIFAFERSDFDSLVLQKISPGGLYLHSFSLAGLAIRQLFIDVQGRIHLALNQADDTPVFLVLDNDLQVIQPAIAASGLTQLIKFQLPADPAVYAYMKNTNTGTPGDFSLSLLKDEQPIWVRTFSPNTPFETFNDFDLDPATGSLTALSFWYNATGFFEPALHHFSIDGSYTNAIINNGLYESAFDMALMPNGNTYVAFEKKLDLYSLDFQLIKSTDISNAPSGGRYFKNDTVFYRANAGTLDAYSEQGNTLFNLMDETITTGFSGTQIDHNRYLTTASIFGEIFGVNTFFGWRWLRGRLRIFDLETLQTSSSNEQTTMTSIAIKCQPIPATNRLQIDGKNFLGKDINLRLTSISGAILFENTYKSINQSNISLDLSAVANGSY